MRTALRSLFLPVLLWSLPRDWAQAPGVERLLPQSSTGPETTIKVNSAEVLVDVTVTDKHDNPIGGLMQEDFQILEDGRAQKIAFFEAHPSSQDAASLKPLPPQPPRVYTNFVDAAGSGVVNVLLLDALNTPVADQASAREQMIKFAKGLRPGQPIAVFALTTVLRQLQTFTQDKTGLLAALNDKASSPQQTRLGTEGDERAQMGRDLAWMKATRTRQEAIEAIRHSYQDRIADHRDQRVKLTLDAFQ